MSAFSAQLTEWLTRYHLFVNTAGLTASSDCGRSLGPASGHLWDIYPFLAPCGFTGLFAGLSLSGIPHNAQRVLLQSYVSRHGFRPADSGPFAGTDWQRMTGEDWSNLDPNLHPSIKGVPSPVHPVDLEFLVDGTAYSTLHWHYIQRDLSVNYRLHTWWLPGGPVATVVTFTSCSETLAPFLRPCFVEERGVELDPACRFPASGTARLFQGTTVLTAGDAVTLAVETSTTVPDGAWETDGKPNEEPMTLITISRAESVRERPLRSIQGVTANSQGNLSLATTGSHKLTRFYDELDPERRLVKLVPNTLIVQSTDQPCCSCNDYVATYETLRVLYEKQEALIRRYNETFAMLKVLRDRLKEAMNDRIQPVRLRRGKVERVAGDGISRIRCEYAVIYSNLFEQEQRFPARTLRLAQEQNLVRLVDVSVQQFPRESGFRIVAFTETGIQLSPVAIPALSHQAMRILLELEGGDDETLAACHLTLLPWPSSIAPSTT